MPRTVHLVDASPYVFRAYFSLPTSITDPSGKPVNAVRGFADFLIRYLGEEQPTHVGIAFDESLTTSFRNESFPDYKAGRDLPPPELEAQLEACQELAAAFGLEVWVHERFEADDLIATACHSLLARGHRAVVVTSDKDLAQLVGPAVEFYDFAKGVRYGPEEVHERFGVTPEQIPDFLGLAGDAVDNIPGVRGVGPKTAVALLAEFPNLEALYADLGAVAELSIRGARGIAERLESAREMAFLSRELATVCRTAPAPADLRRLRWSGPDPGRVEALAERLGFGSLLERAPRPKSRPGLQ